MTVDKARMVTDVQVVESLRAGDAETFRALIERLEQPVIGYLFRLVGDRETALDIAQDTFLQVYKERGKMPPDHHEAWIYRIATNYGLRYLNRKRLRRMVGLDEPAQSVSLCESLIVQSPENETEIRLLVRAALDQMKPEDAACLQLHFGNGFTYEEIGRVMATSPEAVRKRVARGVEKFRALYDASSKNGKQQRQIR